jgi:integrase
MATLLKRSNGFYYIVSTDETGRRRWKSTGERTKGLALHKLTSIRVQPERNYSEASHLVRPPENQPTKKTIEEFQKEFMDYARQVYTPGNTGIYERAFTSFLRIQGNSALVAVNARSVDMFKVKRLADGIAKNTVNLELRSLKAAFNIALRWELIGANPFKGVKFYQLDEQAPLFFSIEDFKKLIENIAEEWFRDIVIIGAMTGMRRGEILNLTWNAIDLERRVIMIQSSDDYRTKRGKKRVIPMNDTVLAVLQRRKLTGYSPKFVFSDESGEKISRSALSVRFKRRVKKLKLDERLHFHSLRHSFASWLVQSGAASIFEVQKLLGHTNIKTTEIYSHLLPENLLETVNRLPLKFDA